VVLRVPRQVALEAQAGLLGLSAWAEGASGTLGWD
jgi:hypothetical protein